MGQAKQQLSKFSTKSSKNLKVLFSSKKRTREQEYASAGKVFLDEHIMNFFETCVETNRQTDPHM